MEYQRGAWYRHPVYGTVRDLIPVAPDARRSITDAAPPADDDEKVFAELHGAAVDAQPGAPTLQEIRSAFEKLRTIAEQVGMKFGIVAPSTIFSTEEKGASCLGALAELVGKIRAAESLIQRSSSSGARMLIDSFAIAQGLLQRAHQADRAHHGYAAFARTKGPEASAGMDDSTPQKSPSEFFNGKPHVDGMRAYKDAQARGEVR